MRPWLLVGPLLLSACAPPPAKQLTAIITTRQSESVEVAAEQPPPQRYKFSSPDSVPQLTPRELPAALRFLEALVELEKLRKMYPDRHEVIFNEALLVDGYGFTTGVYPSELMLQTTIRLYREFIESARKDPDAGDAVYIAHNRLKDIESMVYCEFTKESERDRKQREAEEKQQAAREEIDRGEAEDAAKAAAKH